VLCSEKSINLTQKTSSTVMKFTSFATVIISAAAMAGVVIASVDPVVPVTPANEPSPNGPNVVPCDKPGEYFRVLRADLKPHAYGRPPIQWGAQRVSMVTTTATILGSPAQVTAAPRPGCHASAKIVAS
jgi:hypothetical protein